MNVVRTNPQLLLLQDPLPYTASYHSPTAPIRITYAIHTASATRPDGLACHLCCRHCQHQDHRSPYPLASYHSTYSSRTVCLLPLPTLEQTLQEMATPTPRSPSDRRRHTLDFDERVVASSLTQLPPATQPVVEELLDDNDEDDQNLDLRSFRMPPLTPANT